MKANAAATLRRALEARSAKPEEPCALLLGNSYEARASLRRALGAGGGLLDATPEEGCPLRTDTLETGAVLIELPEQLRGAAEVTELATFLRGLREAHGVVIACGADVPCNFRPASPVRGRDMPLDTLALVTEFYGPPEIRLLLAVVAPEERALEAGLARTREVLSRLPPIWAAHAPPEVLCVDGEEAAQRQELLARLACLPPAQCEPLRSASPLLTQYRAIRQQLDSRRPESIRSYQSALERRAHAQHVESPHGRRPQSPGGHDVGGSSGAQQPETPGGLSNSGRPSSELASPSGSSHAAQLASPSEASGLEAGLHLPYRRQWTVMVFGKTGAGKSHLANLLVGHKAFASGDSVASVTGEESVKKAESRDESLIVLDTIGFGDTKLPPDAVVRSLRDTALEAPGGIDALFFVLKKERVTVSEQETLAYVTEFLFGQECLPNLYMVVTHAGRLAKEVQLRDAWLKEQAAASSQFAAILSHFGPNPVRRIAFVENSDPTDAEDEEDRSLAERRRHRAIADIRALLERHRAPPYQHGIMLRAGELHAARLEEMRAELRARVEEEVRRELERDRGELDAERQQLRTEMETLKEKEEMLHKRVEEEWHQMKEEFATRARELARNDLEPLAQEIVEKTEKKASGFGRWCTVM